MEKKIIVSALCLLLMFSIVGFTSTLVKVKGESQAIEYSKDAFLWESANGANFGEDYLTPTSGTYEWKTNKLPVQADIDFTVDENLALNAMGDWKWEYITFTTDGTGGLDAGTGTPSSKNSVSIVWGWVTDMSVVEIDGSGNVVYNKKLGPNEGDIIPEGWEGDANIIHQFPYYNYDKAFNFKISIREVDGNVVFGFEIITKSPWGHDIDYKWTYTSANAGLLGAKNMFVGRTGTGAPEGEKYIRYNIKVTGVKEETSVEPPVDYSKDASLWESVNGANFGDEYLAPTSAVYEWKTNKLPAQARIDFKVDENLGLNVWADWKWEYITFTTDGTGGLDAGSGNTLSKNSVSLVWGWTTQMSLIEIDGEGNIIYNKHLGGNVGDIQPEGWEGDSEIIRQFQFYNFDKPFQFYIDVLEDGLAGSVTFNFRVVTKSPWGHNIDYKWSYVSTNTGLLGARNMYVGRTGSGSLEGGNYIRYNITVQDLVEKGDSIRVVETLIKELPAEVSFANYIETKEAYEKAFVQFTALEAADQAKVGNVAKLNSIGEALANINQAELVTYLIEHISADAYSIENHKENGEYVMLVYNMYLALEHDDKVQISQENRSRLSAEKDRFEEFELIVFESEQVDSLIEKIVLPITVYGKDKKVILKAKTAFDALIDEQKVYVTKKATLDDAMAALAEYESGLESGLYNFTGSLDNFIETDGFNSLQATESGLIVESQENNITIIPAKKVERSVTFEIDADLTAGGWGNFYFILKHDSAKRCHNGGTWLQEGNYAVVLIGGDGFKFVECIDGSLPMTVDAASNPIAAWSQVADDISDAEGSNGDVWYIYKQYTKVTFEITDLYNESNQYTGFNVKVILVGGKSGQTIVREFNSSNTNVEGAGYVGLELFVGTPINSASSDGFSVFSITMDDVTEYDGASIKAEIAAKEKAKEVDSALAPLKVEITKANVEEIQIIYNAAKNAFDALSEYEKSFLTEDPSVLTTVAATIAELKQILADEKAVSDVEKLIAKIVENVTKDTLEEAKATLKAAKDAYDALSAELKSKIQDTSIFERVSQLIESVENEDDVLEPTKKGCGSSVASMGLVLALCGLLVIKKRRNK